MVVNSGHIEGYEVTAESWKEFVEMLNNVENKENKNDVENYGVNRCRKMINAIKALCDLAGFSIENRIVIRDLKTGKVWR